MSIDILKKIGKSPTILLFGVLVVVLLIGQSQAMAPSSKNLTSANKTITLSPQFVAWSNAPNITQGQKEQTLKIASTSDVYNKYIQYAHGQIAFGWEYPYSGTIFLATVINSSQYFGLLYLDVYNDNVTYAGFTNWRSYESKSGSVPPASDVVTSNSVTPNTANGNEESVVSCSDSNYYSVMNSIVSNMQNHYYSATTLLGSYDTIAELEAYFSNDYNMLLYTNCGYTDSSIDGGPCNGIYVYNGNSYDILTAQDITGLQPDMGLSGADVLIGGCNSYNGPMIGAFISDNPNFYIGCTHEVWADNCDYTCQDFWTYYINDMESPQTALNNACANHQTSGLFALATF